MTSTGRDKISLEKALRVLRDLPLLKGLTDAEFRQVVQTVRSETLIRGKPLISPGEANTNLYVVRRGRMGYRKVVGLRSESSLDELLPGAYVNLTAFLTGARNDFSLEAEDDSELIYLERGPFQELMRARPEIAARLRLPDDVRVALEDRKTNEWMVDGEKIEVMTTRHWWSFASKLIPLVLPLIGMIVAYRMWPDLSPLFGVAVAALGLLWTGWHFIDWRNDFYAVTNYRVIHRERTILIRDDQEEARLDKVQNTSVNQNSLLAQLLDYGDVGIETAGVGAAVTFEMIHEPRQVAEMIITLRDQSKAMVWATDHQLLRGDIRREIGAAPKPPDTLRKAVVYKSPIRLRWEGVAKSIRNARNSLLPRVRLQEGDKVTFRKHWLRLIETAGAQLGLLFFIFPVLFVLFLTTESLRPGPGIGVWLYAGALLFSLGWFLWRYEDWRNDIYVLDKDRVIDIDRSPFGILGTKRREARYDSIQNVSASTRGPIDLIFNVGDVTVKTGGADNALVFERVFDPLSVQRELQGKVDTYKAGQKERERAQQRIDLSEAIGIYHGLRMTPEKLTSLERGIADDQQDMVR
jgi:membrane protein YdbS with pleckstrin-like domain